MNGKITMALVGLCLVALVLYTVKTETVEIGKGEPESTSEMGPRSSFARENASLEFTGSHPPSPQTIPRIVLDELPSFDMAYAESVAKWFYGQKVDVEAGVGGFYTKPVGMAIYPDWIKYDPDLDGTIDRNLLSNEQSIEVARRFLESKGILTRDLVVTRAGRFDAGGVRVTFGPAPVEGISFIGNLGISVRVGNNGKTITANFDPRLCQYRINGTWRIKPSPAALQDILSRRVNVEFAPPFGGIERNLSREELRQPPARYNLTKAELVYNVIKAVKRISNTTDDYGTGWMYEWRVEPQWWFTGKGYDRNGRLISDYVIAQVPAIMDDSMTPAGAGSVVKG